MTSILKWIENELLEKVLEAEIGKVVDGPTTASSLLTQLPLREWGFVNCPGDPVLGRRSTGTPISTHVHRRSNGIEKRRADQAAPTAYHGLVHRLHDRQPDEHPRTSSSTAPADPAARPAASPHRTSWRSTRAEDFTLPWTTYEDVYKDSQDLVRPFAKTLTDADDCDAELLADDRELRPAVQPARPREGRRRQRAGELRRRSSATPGTTEDMAAHQAAGLLYEIDMSILASLEPFTALDGTVRFTPGTVTRADAGSDDQGAHADRDPALDERRPTTRLHQQGQRRGSMRSRRRRPRSRCGASGSDTSITGTSSRPRCR